MSPGVKLLLVAALVLTINVPFGYWRAGVRKFSVAWFVAVHGPVPLVVLLRVASGMEWRLVTVPVLVTSYFAGQFLGGWLRHRRATPQGG